MLEQERNRVYARSIARELTPEELTEVGGGASTNSQATSVPSGDPIQSYPDDTTIYGC
jgi:hypothetical protein